MLKPTARVRLANLANSYILWGGNLRLRDNTIWVMWIERYGRRASNYYDPKSKHEYDELDELPLHIEQQPIIFEASWKCPTITAAHTNA